MHLILNLLFDNPNILTNFEDRRRILTVISDI